MSLIHRFRIDNNRPEKDQLEFYLKINNASNRKLLNLCIDGEGVYYYKRGSQILTPKENRKTRDTFDGCLSMSELKQIFDLLAKAGWKRSKWNDESLELKVTQSKTK